jgi:hypothetical protein
LAARNDVRWPAFVEASIWHGVAQIAAGYLVCSEMDAVIPGEVRRFFQGYRTANAARSRALLAESGHVVEALRAAGIESIVLKGAALAATVYPEPGLRNFADIDILVQADRLREAEEAIAPLGYRARRAILPDSLTHECCRMGTADLLTGTLAPDFIPAHAAYLIEDFTHRIALELHRGLFRTLDGLWRRVGLEPFWGGAAVFSPSPGSRARMLSPEAMLIHLAAHAGDHAFGRLLFPIDAAFVIAANGDTLSWERLPEMSRAYGAADRVHTLLSYARQICEAQISDDGPCTLQTRGSGRLVAPVAAIFPSGKPARSEVVLRRLLRSAKLGDAAASAVRLLGPPASTIREIYGVRSAPMVALCYLVRPFHLAARTLRLVVQSAAAGRP